MYETSLAFHCAGEVRRLTLAHKFEIVPVDSIRGRVQNARTDTVACSVQKSGARCLNCFKFCENVCRREKNVFFVYWFTRELLEKFDVVEEK